MTEIKQHIKNFFIFLDQKENRKIEDLPTSARAAYFPDSFTEEEIKNLSSEIRIKYFRDSFTEEEIKNLRIVYRLRFFPNSITEEIRDIILYSENMLDDLIRISDNPTDAQHSIRKEIPSVVRATYFNSIQNKYDFNAVSHSKLLNFYSTDKSTYLFYASYWDDSGEYPKEIIINEKGEPVLPPNDYDSAQNTEIYKNTLELLQAVRVNNQK